MKKFLFIVAIPLLSGFTCCRNTDLSSKNKQDDASSGSPMKEVSNPPGDKNKPVAEKKIPVAEAKKPEPDVKTVKKEEELKIPEDPLEKAELYIKAGFGYSAYRVLKNIKPAPDTWKYWYTRALALYTARKFHSAAREAEKSAGLTKETPLQYKSFLLQARALIEMRRHPQAIKLLQSTCAMVVDAHDCHITRLNHFIVLKRIGDSGKLSDELVKKYPGRGEYHLGRLEHFALDKKLTELKDYMNKVVANTQLPVWVRAKAMDIAGAAIAAKNADEGKKLLEVCRKTFPKYGCIMTELTISPPDPRHPDRKIYDVKRKKGGGY